MESKNAVQTSDEIFPGPAGHFGDGHVHATLDNTWGTYSDSDSFI